MKKNENGILIGSGTFVSVRGLHGILTAYHVAHKLEINSFLGLILIPNEHRNTINFQHLKIIDIGKGLIDADGPDLSFIVLPDMKVSEIKPYKHFIDLSVDRERMLNNPPETHGGIWFLCGALGERTKEEESTRGFGQILSIEGMCAAVGVDRFYIQNGFDYIEADAEYDKGLDIPNTFGGMSGGGLWQVPFKKYANGKFEAVNYFLSGVAFYESDVKQSKRFIKCHGRMSIYQNVYNKVSSEHI